MRMRLILLAGAALLPTASLVAQGGDAPAPPPFTAELAYTGDYAHNLGGGFATGGGFQGLLTLDLRFDTQAAGWWPGGLLRVGGSHLHGGDPTIRHAGAAQTASDIEDSSTTRLVTLSFAQELGGGFSLLAGTTDLNEEFAAAEAAGQFINSSFGLQPDLGLNLSLATYPISAPGLRLAWSDEAFTLRAAAYDGKPCSVDDSDHGDCFHLSKADGAFLIAEAEWRPAATTKLKLGAWRHTSDFPDLERAAPRATVDGNAGLYGMVESSLSGAGEARGLDAFLQLGYAPEDRNPIHAYLGAGLVWRGPFAARLDDSAGVAIAHARHGEPYQRRSGLRDHETILELNYRFALGEHWALRPDLQWIRHPGLAPGLDDAFLAMLRVEAMF